MSIPMLVFIIAYVAVTISYLFSETSGNFKRRAINKIFLASMFLIYATFETIRHGNLGNLQIVALIGVTFAYCGDVLLLWSFSKGGVAFSIGNIILFCYELAYFAQNGLSFSDYWWFLIIFAVMAVTFVTLVVKKWYTIPGKLNFWFCIYIISVTLHGTLSIAGLTQLHDVKSILLCCGLILFMISDYFISLHKFKYKKSKAILRCNSSTYFIGLMLVALSFSF